MKYLFDTNICIYLLKKHYVKIAKKVEKIGIENIFISTISIAELEFGIAKSNKPEENEDTLYKFLVPFTTVTFDHNSARLYGKIRANLQKKGTPIGNMDMLIASVALANDMTIVTNNVKEFKRVPELIVENWIT
jgi:tRNA(fMet)-specific endonuclease VapC